MGAAGRGSLEPRLQLTPQLAALRCERWGSASRAGGLRPFLSWSAEACPGHALPAGFGAPTSVGPPHTGVRWGPDAPLCVSGTEYEPWRAGLLV